MAKNVKHSSKSGVGWPKVCKISSKSWVGCPKVWNIRQNHGSDGQKWETFVKIKGPRQKVDDSFALWSKRALKGIGRP